MQKRTKWYKKFLAVLLVGVMVIGTLAGCGQKSDEKESTKQNDSQQEGTTADTSSESESTREVITDPITIKIMTTRGSLAQLDNADDLWMFKYVEYCMNQKGYNITLEVEALTDAAEQVALMLGTGELPDIVWGYNISATDIMKYGEEEGLILDWTSYINEETMPNLYGYLQENPNALLQATTPSGSIYALGAFADRGYLWSAGNLAFTTVQTWINTKWLEACDLEVPTNIDDFVDMLRAFKNMELESGETAIPALAVNGLLERYFWTCLGYYGNNLNRYGTAFAIKDEQVELPAATEDYRTLVELMNTLYTEGLIPQDYFTMESATVNSLAQSGVVGVIGQGLSSAVPANFSDYTVVRPMTIGDNDEVVVSVADSNKYNRMFVSAETEYPEVIAEMVDMFYDMEFFALTKFGPMQGEDPLGILDGWYVKDGMMTNDKVLDGTYASYDAYCQNFIWGSCDVANAVYCPEFVRNEDGSAPEWEHKSYIDAVTGEEVDMTVKAIYTKETADGYGRLVNAEYWGDQGYVSTVYLPIVYMSSDDTIRAEELGKLIKDYITTQTVAFITGTRPLSEIDNYYKELEDLGVEEYIELYREAYSNYMNTIFK